MIDRPVGSLPFDILRTRIGYPFRLIIENHGEGYIDEKESQGLLVRLTDETVNKVEQVNYKKNYKILHDETRLWTECVYEAEPRSAREDETRDGDASSKTHVLHYCCQRNKDGQP